MEENKKNQYAYQTEPNKPTVETTTDHVVPTLAQFKVINPDQYNQIMKEIHQTNEEKYKAFLKLVHQPTPPEFIKSHDALKVKINGKFVPYEYLPIDKVEWSLHRVFGVRGWKREIIDAQQIFNSVMITVRLHFLIPGINTWSFHDGIGAVGAQTDKGESASTISAIKFDAIQKAAPAAASYALSNAAEKIGSLFGGNINKSDVIPFVGMWDDKRPEVTTTVVGTSNGTTIVAGDMQDNQNTTEWKPEF